MNSNIIEISLGKNILEGTNLRLNLKFDHLNSDQVH